VSGRVDADRGRRMLKEERFKLILTAAEGRDTVF
jgi:hypothetical protein